MKTGLFHKVFLNIALCFRGKNLIWQVAGWAATAILVLSGFDEWYALATRGALLQAILFPAVIVGFFVPVILPGFLYGAGALSKRKSLTQTAHALAQAAVLALGISSTYKVFTGRMGPMSHDLTVMASDISHAFRFGILRGGAFQGWPSSHTSVAFAMAFALITLYPEKKWLKYAGVIYALYIGIGVSTNIHWFSDVVMGAILGTIIGISVGKSFKDQV